MLRTPRWVNTGTPVKTAMISSRVCLNSVILAISSALAMQEFRDGRRPATVMDRHAKAYSDEEIASIADYLSRIK